MKYYHRCEDCKWLDDEKTIIGFKCLHPDRPFLKSRDKYSAYKYGHTPACSRWQKNEMD